MANRSGYLIDIDTILPLIYVSTVYDSVKARYPPMSFSATIPFTVNTTAGTTLADENIGLFFCNG